MKILERLTILSINIINQAKTKFSMKEHYINLLELVGTTSINAVEYVLYFHTDYGKFQVFQN